MTPAASAPPVALYIHIPFCVSLCPYCDFVVFAGAAARGPRARVDAFVAALEVELALRADALDAAFGERRPPLETVYLGGGTPSLLPADAVARPPGARPGALRVWPRAPRSRSRPTPARTNAATRRRFRAAGVTRLSIGAQSMSDAGLRRLGRRHRAADVVAAVAAAREGGIASVSLDLLYDAPGRVARSTGSRRSRRRSPWTPTISRSTPSRSTIPTPKG